MAGLLCASGLWVLLRNSQRAALGSWATGQNVMPHSVGAFCHLKCWQLQYNMSTVQPALYNPIVLLAVSCIHLSDRTPGLSRVGGS